LPARIEELETLTASLNSKISAADFYKQSPQQVEIALKQLQQSEEALSAAYARWEELDANK
jgi:hypothetical protein